MIVTMTMWKPELTDDGTPVYIAIADAIDRDIQRGALTNGSRLPTHRELASHLGVTVGTVTRGYAEAGRRGLTTGEVGRGTFVSTWESPQAHGWDAVTLEDGGGLIDLSLATPWIPPDGSDNEALARTMKELAAAGLHDDLLAYHPESAPLRHRTIAAAFLARLGVDLPPEQIVVASGAQHATTVALSTLLRAGDTLLLAELSYPGIKGIAQMLGLRTRAVAMDEGGIIPEALERACHDGSAHALYCDPTLQNPTLATLSPERRARIAAIAREHDLLILEDEVNNGPGGISAKPLASYAPERTIYISTLSKSVTFGLRIGFVAAPADLIERVRSGVRSTLWMSPGLITEIATRWLADGTARTIAERKLKELAARDELVREVLGERFDVRSDPQAVFAWLQLPEPWRSDDFVAIARQRGVLVAGAEAFAVGRSRVPHAVRIATARAPHRAQLRRGLEIIADILDGSAEPCVDIL